MNIKVDTIKEPLQPGGDAFTKAKVITIDSQESFKFFQELVQRATNLWPDAPAEIKEFADKITNDGRVLQDYNHESNHHAPRYAHYHQCKVCSQISAIWTIVNTDPDYPVRCEKEVKIKIPAKLDAIGLIETPETERIMACGVVARFNKAGTYSYPNGESHVSHV